PLIRHSTPKGSGKSVRMKMKPRAKEQQKCLLSESIEVDLNPSGELRRTRHCECHSVNARPLRHVHLTSHSMRVDRPTRHQIVAERRFRFPHHVAPHRRVAVASPQIRVAPGQCERRPTTVSDPTGNCVESYLSPKRNQLHSGTMDWMTAGGEWNPPRTL